MDLEVYILLRFRKTYYTFTFHPFSWKWGRRKILYTHATNQHLGLITIGKAE